jgi:septal ring factor EnvC (AmiA/AmiB activator)
MCEALRIPTARVRCDRIVLLGWTLLTVSTWMSLSAAAIPSNSSEALEARSHDLEQIQQTVEALGAELIRQQGDRQVLIEELETREREVAAAAIKGRELARQIAEQTRLAERLRVRQIEEHGSLDQELAVWADLIRTAYVMGRADRLRLLLNQEDTAKATRILSYFAYLNRAQLSRVDAIRTQIEQLTRLASEAERESARLLGLARDQETVLAQLEQAKTERAAVLRQLEESITSRTLDLRSLERDAQALRQLVEHLRQRAQMLAELEIQREPFKARKGRLGWPLLGSHVLAAFGTPKQDTELRWDGVLLAAHEGEEVRAVYDGRVLHADWLRGFGLLIVIDHGDGYMSLYGHNEALLKEPGEWVAAGEVIALSGKSGGRDEPVLYFAIRYNGRPQDPAAWCDGPAREGAHLPVRQAHAVSRRERPRIDVIQLGQGSAHDPRSSHPRDS